MRGVTTRRSKSGQIGCVIASVWPPTAVGPGLDFVLSTRLLARAVPAGRARPAPSPRSRRSPRSSNPAISRNVRASRMAASRSSPREPRKLNRPSTVRWNSSAARLAPVSSLVTSRNQVLPIFTWVTSSASIQSSAKYSTGSCISSAKSRMVVNTSMARPSSARFTPARRNTGSGWQAASNRVTDSLYSPTSVPMCSPSIRLISTWRASSQHCRAMSSFIANGVSSVV